MHVPYWLKHGQYIRTPISWNARKISRICEVISSQVDHESNCCGHILMEEQGFSSTGFLPLTSLLMLLCSAWLKAFQAQNVTRLQHGIQVDLLHTLLHAAHIHVHASTCMHTYMYMQAHACTQTLFQFNYRAWLESNTPSGALSDHKNITQEFTTETSLLCTPIETPFITILDPFEVVCAIHNIQQVPR